MLSVHTVFLLESFKKEQSHEEFAVLGQGFLIELSLFSKERKNPQIQILGGTDNMKHDTAANKTCRRL